MQVSIKEKTEMIATVWTQPNCSHCDRVKVALIDAGFQIVERDISQSSDLMRDQFKKTYKTTPQVFVGQKLVGTADETIAWLQTR